MKTSLKQYSICVLYLTIYVITHAQAASQPYSLTFEVPNRDKFCFFEQINTTEPYFYGYQVLSGGDLDINAHVSRHEPNVVHVGEDTILQKVYVKMRSKKDQIRLSFEPGTYVFCFGNEFSAISHKVVNFLLVSEKRGMELHLKSKDGIKTAPIGEDTAETLMETTSTNIYAYLREVFIAQRQYKNRDAMGYFLAHKLNTRVMWWSASEMLLMLLVSLGQVFILRRFFTDKKQKYTTKKSLDTPAVLHDVPLARREFNIET